MFDKSAYMKRYRIEHPEVIERFLEHHPNYKNEYNSKHNPVNSQIHNPRRIVFKKKRVYLKQSPRKGYCSKCGKLGITHMHHLEYDEKNPLKHTIELCVSCHMKGHKDKK